MTCGIYKITNRINGHAYIGMSVNIEKRYVEHMTKGLHSTRKDDLDKPLYKAIKKYGKDNFILEILEECPQEELKEKEQFYIALYNTYEDRKHYNATPGGDCPGYNTVHIGEEHGMAVLTEDIVSYCRDMYKEGKRSRDIYNELDIQNTITYGGFLKMWHGKMWKHVKPKVFNNNPHKGKYTAIDRDILTELFKESGLPLHKFQKTDECYVGYGTLYKMIHEPEFYDDK